MIGVYQCVKDTIWKQITTRFLMSWRFVLVFISVSKIQFESKSQLEAALAQIAAWCLSVCQRYNLKANHNTYLLAWIPVIGVYQCVKDTIWKQITTIISMQKWKTWCLSVCQRYNLKANHNEDCVFMNVAIGVYQCVKDTIWKQITTGYRCISVFSTVFISVSKIQFESKSQRVQIWALVVMRCLSVCQRYNLKANHN